MTTLVIDGRTVSARADRTLLDACREAGASVPTLCHLPGLSRPASCRLCLVEVQGFPRPMPACTTRPWEGMVVSTATAALLRHRRDTVESLFAGGGHVCAFCPASGRCELQELARALGLDRVHHGGVRPAPAVDASRPRFAHDPGRCVLCTRCVRACAEQEGARTLSVAGRGARSRISFDGGLPWGLAASCTDCGRCVAACPTGAMVEQGTAAQGIFERPPGAAAPPALAAAPAPPAPPPGTAPDRRLRLATAWLGGCSGCHMSLLDLDGRLLELAPRIALVHSPLVDVKEMPAGVDVCLVEGAVATAEHPPLLRRIRRRARLLVALGDCACTGNVTALRNERGGAAAVERRQAEGIAGGRAAGHPLVPDLLPRARPLHELVEVDLFLPGCPPPASVLGEALEALLDGRAPRLEGRLPFG